MEEAGSAAVRVIDLFTLGVERDSAVNAVIAEAGKWRVPASDRIAFQTLPARIGFPGGVTEENRGAEQSD